MNFFRSPQIRAWLPGLLLVAAVLFAYQPAWNAGFIWDDDEHLVKNTALRDLHGLQRIWFEVGAVPQYYPLVHTIFWLEYRLWGLNPAGYHVVNILLHALGAVLLWRVLERLKLPGAWLAAAIFALHPIQVESVAWITELKNVLSGVFYFAAALAYLRFVDIEVRDNSRKYNWRWYACALLLFIAALLSKTVTCSLPAALLLVLWWKKGRLQRAEVLPTLPFFAVGIALGLLTAWVEKHHIKAQGDDWALTFLDRCLIAGRAPWFYAGKLLWPEQLTFIYPRWEINADVWWQWLFPLSAAGAVAALWLMRRRFGRGPLVAVLFFAGTLFPALGFINVYPMRYSFVADHFQYLASVGLITLFAVGMARLAIRLRMNGMMNWGFALVLLPVLSLMTWRQAWNYHDAESLWRNTLARNPEAWMAHNNLANLLFDKGQLDEAMTHYQRTLEIRPHADAAAYNLANAYSIKGQMDEAVVYYRKALKLEPNGASIAFGLGNALSKKGLLDEAIVYYRKSLEIQPDAAATVSNLGNALLARGQVDEAIVCFLKAVQLSPGSAKAHSNLGNALIRNGRPDEAITHYEAALKIDPTDVPTLSNLSWVLATCPDSSLRNGQKAVELGQTAEWLSGSKSPLVLRTLSAAYAETGRFPEATATAERALELLSDNANSSFANVLRDQIKLYNTHSAVRDPSLTNSNRNSNQP